MFMNHQNSQGIFIFDNGWPIFSYSFIVFIVVFAIGLDNP